MLGITINKIATQATPIRIKGTQSEGKNATTKQKIKIPQKNPDNLPVSQLLFFMIYSF
jgi:hypothetical protein